MEGLYPPNEATKAQYASWVAAGSPLHRLVV
jgi:hypothetical protein